jgi:hypothetical protein
MHNLGYNEFSPQINTLFPAMTTIRPTAQPLGDQHAQITVTSRLVFISKALVRKPENRLVAVYCGFDNQADAQRFAAWVMVNWDKSTFDVAVREGTRTQSDWEVKVRRLNQSQLNALVKKATANPVTPQRGTPQVLRPASHEVEDWATTYRTQGVPHATRVTVGNRTVCID